MVLHVRHGDVVAEQEGQPLIVILEIQALPHTGGQLVDEAKHAVVRAGVLLVAQIGVEIAAEGAAHFALHVPLADAVRHLRFQVKALAVRVEIIVQRIVQLVLVHAQQLVAGLQTEGLRFAALFDPLDPDCHAPTRLSSFRFRKRTAIFSSEHTFTVSSGEP